MKWDKEQSQKLVERTAFKKGQIITCARNVGREGADGKDTMKDPLASLNV